MYLLVSIVFSLFLVYYVDNKYNHGNFICDARIDNFVECILYVFVFLGVVLGLWLILMYFGLISVTHQSISFSTVIGYLPTVLVTPVLEEYIFRYLPYKYVNGKSIYLVLLSSMLFTFVHYQGIYESIVIFVAGLLLYIMFLKSKRISYSIISHALWNVIMIVMLFI